MKFNTLKLFLATLVIGAFLFAACDETTTEPADGPQIANINPSVAEVGDEVTLTGSGFDFNVSGNYVEIGSLQVQTEDIVTWNETLIRFKVPAGATSGMVKVHALGKVSNGVFLAIGAPAAPTGIMATSLDDETVGLKWTKSADADESFFGGYMLEVTPGGMAPIAIAADAEMYAVTGLDAGMEYTFELKSIWTDGDLESVPATITWSPAFRFTTDAVDQEIKVYESSSSFGSGLDLFDEALEGPKTYKTSGTNSGMINFAIKTEGDQIWVGSPLEMTYNWGGDDPMDLEVGNVYENITSLDDIYDSEALNTAYSFMPKVIDVADAAEYDQNSNLAMVVRVKNADDTYNYAKIMLVPATGGGFLHGTAPDRYVVIEVSYQKEVDVPYAL